MEEKAKKKKQPTKPFKLLLLIFKGILFLTALLLPPQKQSSCQFKKWNCG